MVQPGQGPPLTVEPEQQARAGRLAPAGRLDRDATPQRLLDRLVNLAHASPADRSDNSVGAEPRRADGLALSGPRLRRRPERCRLKHLDRFGQLAERLGLLRVENQVAVEHRLGVRSLEQLLLEAQEQLRDGTL